MAANALEGRGQAAAGASGWDEADAAGARTLAMPTFRANRGRAIVKVAVHPSRSAPAADTLAALTLREPRRLRETAGAAAGIPAGAKAPRTAPCTDRSSPSGTVAPGTRLSGSTRMLGVSAERAGGPRGVGCASCRGASVGDGAGRRRTPRRGARTRPVRVQRARAPGMELQHPQAQGARGREAGQWRLAPGHACDVAPSPSGSGIEAARLLSTM